MVKKNIISINLFIRFFSLLLIGLGVYFIISGLLQSTKEPLLNSDNANIGEGISTHKPIYDNNESTDNTVLQGSIVNQAQVTSLNISGIQKSQINQTKMIKYNKWIATNYIYGEIDAGNYRVQKGDTLWELAEGVYGDGSKWHVILAANREDIGLLENGSQALIRENQLLIIPAL